jgi:pSer/pThr/pTyr-binding forkhead associated (FHA) protein
LSTESGIQSAVTDAFETASFGAIPEPDWQTEARSQLDEPGQYLAWEDGHRLVMFQIARDWTRIGRSIVADVRFEDSTVSRRHALLLRRPDGVRVLDDGSLNGVYVNGERVEWRPLRDGDEIQVGRHLLRFIEVRAPVERPLVAYAAGNSES